MGVGLPESHLWDVEAKSHDQFTLLGKFLIDIHKHGNLPLYYLEIRLLIIFHVLRVHWWFTWGLMKRMVRQQGVQLLAIYNHTIRCH